MGYHPFGLAFSKLPEKVPWGAPVAARSLVTVLSMALATQMLSPSKATPCGPVPTLNAVVRLAEYHRRRAI